MLPDTGQWIRHMLLCWSLVMLINGDADNGDVTCWRYTQVNIYHGSWRNLIMYALDSSHLYRFSNYHLHQRFQRNLTTFLHSWIISAESNYYDAEHHILLLVSGSSSTNVHQCSPMRKINMEQSLLHRHLLLSTKLLWISCCEWTVMYNLLNYRISCFVNYCTHCAKWAC